MAVQKYKNALLWVNCFLHLFAVGYVISDFSFLAQVDTGRSYFRFQSPMAMIGELVTFNAMTFNWWFTAVSYLLALLVPFTAFMALAVSNIRNPQKQFRGAVTAHMIIGALVTLALFAAITIMTVHLLLANNEPAKNLSGTNLANDDRYCCVPSYAQVDSNCPNHVSMGAPIPCENPIIASQLGIRPGFWIRYVSLILVLGFTIATVIVAWRLRGHISVKYDTVDDDDNNNGDIAARLIIPAKAARRRRHY